MFKNYLNSAVRFIKHNKVFAAINFLGLSIALAASFIILLFVINELSYNTCHTNRRNVYRIINYYSDFQKTVAGTPYVLASTMKQEFPQVVKATNIRYAPVRFKVKEENLMIRTYAASSDIFSIFTIPIISGAPKDSLLDEENSLVISRHTAEKYFPGENPLGKDVTGVVNGKNVVFTIKAVFENFPANSTIQGDCFVNSKWTLDALNKSFKVTDADVNWTFDFWNTWIMLRDGSNPADLEKLFPEFAIKHISEKPKNSYSLQNLSDVYLGSTNIANSGMAGDLKNIKLFSIIAFLIVLVASVNYIILSTTVSTSRSKEIGVRKTFGADNNAIRIQLLGESIFLVLIVLPLSVLLARLALPVAGKLFQTNLTIIPSNIGVYMASYFIVTFLIGIFSGFYTSFYLARLKVNDVLRNRLQSGRNKELIRASLIVLQLVIFCSFVSGTLIIRSQYNYALKKNTGHYTHDILVIKIGQGFQGYSSFLNNIKSNPNIIMAAGVMESLPMVNSGSMMYPNFKNPESKVEVEGMAVDYNFIKTIGIQVLQGREFSEEFGSDLKQSCMLNETAVRALDLTDPVGKKLGGLNIIGVVKDFNLHSLRSDIPPIQINMTDSYILQIAVHYKTGTLSTILPFLRTEWKKVAPDRTFTYITIEDMLRELYSSEKNLSIIVTIFSLFILLISTLGLFGLVLFTSQSRTKEIGVRKVFGSTGNSIILSFLRSHFLLVTISVILSVPVTLWFMRKWLSGYAYHTNINPLVFAVAFILAASVVLATIFFHSWKASRTNPVSALKYE